MEGIEVADVAPLKGFKRLDKEIPEDDIYSEIRYSLYNNYSELAKIVRCSAEEVEKRMKNIQNEYSKRKKEKKWY